MGRPAANASSMAQAVDTHIVLVPTAGGPVPTPLPHPFLGQIASNLVSSVLIAGQPAAVVGSVANNQPPHIATPPGTAFQSPPSNQGTVHQGSTSVQFGGKAAARHGDPVKTCNDPTDVPVGTVIAPTPTVVIG